MKLSHWDVKNRNKARMALSEIDRKFEKRVGEVLEIIHKAFGKKLNNWWFLNAREGKMGSIESDFADKDGWVDICLRQYSDLNAGGYDFSYGFPERYLFMRDDLIVEELRQGFKEEAKKVVERKSRVIKKKKIRKQALAKLTEEDKKALEL